MTHTSYCDVILQCSCQFFVLPIYMWHSKGKCERRSHLIFIASCRLLEYETRHIGRMWMWLHIRNVVCEQEAKKYCSELELNWVCETDAINKHINAHINKVTGLQAVTVALCTRYSGHLRIVWRHQQRTLQKATIQGALMLPRTYYVSYLFVVFFHLQLDLPRSSLFLFSHQNSYPPKLILYLPRVPLFIVLTTLANLQSFKSWSFWLYTTFGPSLGLTISLSTGFEHPQRAIEFRIQTRRATKL